MNEFDLVLPTSVDVREVGMRDGLQLEDPVPLDAKLEMLEALVATGVRRIEATSFVSPKAVPALADADLVVWDPKATKTISAATQVSAIDYNVFEGVACEGLPRVVLSRGEVAVEGGKVLAEPGRGRFVPRQPFPAEAKALRRCRDVTAPKAVAR